MPHEYLHRSDLSELNEVKYRARGIPQQRKEEEKDINLDIKQCATQANKNIGLPSAGHSARQIIYQWPAPAAISFSLHAARRILDRNKCRIEILGVRCLDTRLVSHSRIDQA